MREKYRAIVEADFILQIDDPGIATSWDMLKPEPSLADYRKYVTLRIEALNHALAGIPPEKVCYHWCRGSWHGAGAGAAGTARMSTTSLSNTSSTSLSTRKPTLSRN